MIVVRWCVVDTRKLVGKPQEQGYDEHNNMFSLSCETKVIEPVGVEKASEVVGDDT